jgi:alkanesulfonate monooxygenase SsuD/methylene tetrahydromethanopterin reductase-like flavin-dependent oxidoreductase (luciferase family)
VVSPATATISAGRRSKICTAFESVARIKEIFDAYRAAADRTGFAGGPDHLAIRRNITVATSEAEALDTAQMAKEMTRKVLAGDPRVKAASSSLLDAKTGFAVHDDEYIAGTPAQVAEQIVEQCRACGAGHILAILGRAIDERRTAAVTLFGEEVIPMLRRAQIA